MAGALALLLVGGVVVVGPRIIQRLTPEPTFSPETPLAEQCDEVPRGAERITVTADDGSLLGAALVGPANATVGVVLRQGGSQTICEWLPWAGQVAEATGARVLLFDRRGHGSSPGEGNLSAEPGDTLRAIDRLRHEGQHEVAMVASSMGNSIMFTTGPRVSPAPCAVASISPVLTASDNNGALDATPLLGLPDNLWVTWESEGTGVSANARAIQRAALEQRLPAPRTLPVDTSDHSLGLVNNHAEVREFLIEAISSCSG